MSINFRGKVGSIGAIGTGAVGFVGDFGEQDKTTLSSIPGNFDVKAIQGQNIHIHGTVERIGAYGHGAIGYFSEPSAASHIVVGLKESARVYDKQMVQNRVMIIISYYGLRESLAGGADALRRKEWTVYDYPFYLRREQLCSDPEDHEAVQNTLANDLVAFIELWNVSVVMAWCNSLDTERWKFVKEKCPSITSALFNWDDPYWWCIDADFASKRAAVMDVAFTSCQTSVDWYTYYGTKRAVFLPPGFDPKVFGKKKTLLEETDDSALGQGVVVDHRYRCDVSFAFTNYYTDCPLQIIDREKLVRALCEAKDINFHIYGPEHIKRDWNEANYKGHIHYFDTAKLFAQSTLNLCTHAIGVVPGYVNERTILVPASGGVLLVDKVLGIESVVSEDRGECIYIDVENPVEQIRTLLKNRQRLKWVAEEGREHMLENYTWDRWADTIDATLATYWSSPISAYDASRTCSPPNIPNARPVFHPLNYH